MKWIFVALLLTGAACRTTTPNSPGQADIDTNQKIPADSILIVGVRIPGIYRIPAEGTSIDDAIKAAGGPEMCDYCFERGGEETLWRRIGSPRLTRDGVEYRVPKEHRQEWTVLPGDRLMITHIPF